MARDSASAMVTTIELYLVFGVCAIKQQKLASNRLHGSQ